MASKMSYGNVLIAGGCAVTLYLSLKTTKSYLHNRSLLSKCKLQQDNRQKSIEVVKEQLNQTAKYIRHEIQNLSYQELKEALQNGKYSARQVLHSFQEMAIKAHDKTNCLTEFVLEADEWAQALDKHHKRNELPLFGMPFSVKESLWQKGYLSTRGVVAQLASGGAPSTHVVVQTLQDAGAIPFVRTNAPQTLFSFGCANPIYGRTTNPFNATRTSGGSSGGDAALIVCKGALFGIGSDIAGSIRLPAHYSGCCGIKPTHNRLSNVGCAISNAGRAVIEGTNGPLACCMDCLQDVMFVLCSHNQMHQRDCSVPPIPWTIPQQSDGVRIGWFSTSAYMRCTDAVQNAVRNTMQMLSAQGHQLVPFELPDLEKVWGWTLTTAMTDEGRFMTEELNVDIMNEDDKQFQTLMAMNKTWRRVLLAWRQDGRSLQMYNDIAGSTYELRKVYCAVRQYRSKVLQMWRSLELQALLCPPCASVAMHPELVMQTIPAYVYTTVFNLLDLPSGVVHVGHVTQDDVMAHASGYPKHDLIDRHMQEFNGTQEAIGLPIGVQVAALPYEEETCLQVMSLIQECKQCPIIA